MVNPDHNMSLIDANEKWARRSSEDPEITHETWDFPTTMRVLSTTEVLWPNDLSEGYACSGLANWALLTHFTSADWPWFYLQKTDGWPSKMTKRIHWYPKMFNPKRQGSALEGCLVKVILAQHPSNRTKQVIWLVDWCWLAPQNMVVIRDVFLPCGWKKTLLLSSRFYPSKTWKKITYLSSFVPSLVVVFPTFSIKKSMISPCFNPRIGKKSPPQSPQGSDSGLSAPGREWGPNDFLWPLGGPKICWYPKLFWFSHWS